VGNLLKLGVWGEQGEGERGPVRRAKVGYVATKGKTFI